MNTYLIGIDIGGTSIKGGLLKNDHIEKQSVQPVNTDDAQNVVLEKVFRVIDDLLVPEVKAIGIGVPGLVDNVKGIIYDLQNIPSWVEVPLKDILEKRYALPVSVNNDANCFAVGERYFGDGKQFDHFLGLTLGTGLGMGIITNGHLYSGEFCGAGEVGMIPYKDGILEYYASSQFFKRTHNTTGLELSSAAAKGDPEALRIYTEFGSALGDGFLILLSLFAPQAIIMGGAISKGYPYFKEALHKKIDSFVLKRQLENFKVLVTDHPQMGILGAAALCLDHMDLHKNG